MAPSMRAVSKLLERREQDVLQFDGQRQQPVEESGDRRQLVLDPIAVGQLQAGRRPRMSAASSLSTLPATSSR